MINLSRPLIAVLLLSLFIAGCKKDKEETAKNQFNYNGTEFALAQGFLENYGKYDAEEGNNIDLTLLSSAYTIHEKNGEVDSVSGTGNALYFEIFTSLTDKLDVRDYVFDGTESFAAGTFDYAMVGMDYNLGTETGSFFEITGGKISVTGNGAEYEITFNCTASNGKTITGYYKGPLKYYNYVTKKKAATKYKAG